MPTYKAHAVKQGECISSIAIQYGMFPNTIWDDPKNSQLKDLRKDPNVLLPGDVVYVRDIEVKEESCASEQRHRFRRKGVPATLRIQLQLDGEPRANLSYELYVDGALLKEDTTGSDGIIEASIPPNAEEGEIVLTDEDGNEESIPFTLGTLDPIETEEGVRSRLLALGYDVEDLEAAVRAFQEAESLTVSGNIDDDTRNKLKEIYGL